MMLARAVLLGLVLWAVLAFAIYNVWGWRP